MVRIVEDTFGSSLNPSTQREETIKRFTLSNDMQMSVQIITYGATITSIKLPDAHGQVDDVVLGYDNIEGYKTSTNPYFGATVGRVCNRVANGRFTLPPSDEVIQVTRNWNNKHQLHGGFVGFDKVHWVLAEGGLRPDGITLQHRSPDQHEGYPGEVSATVCFTLTEDNCLHVDMQAETTKTTAVNMTNHSYFNLAGHASGKEAIYQHSVQINASSITETDEDSIPTGKLLSVEKTAFDLRTMSSLGEGLKKLLPARGYDDNFCVDLVNNGITVVAKAHHAGSGRWLEVASNQPGVQFYTSNFMPDLEKGEEPIVGKSGALYGKHSAFCWETQKYPDAVNHVNFPSIILNPGEKYNHQVIYKFGVCRGGSTGGACTGRSTGNRTA